MTNFRDFLPALPPYLPLPVILTKRMEEAAETVSPPERYYRVGDRVHHYKFGHGIVKDFSHSYGRWLVTIEFTDEEGEKYKKTFLSEVPYLTKEDISKLKLV